MNTKPTDPNVRRRARRSFKKLQAQAAAQNKHWMVYIARTK